MNLPPLNSGAAPGPCRAGSCWRWPEEEIQAAPFGGLDGYFCQIWNCSSHWGEMWEGEKHVFYNWRLCLWFIPEERGIFSSLNEKKRLQTVTGSTCHFSPKWFPSQLSPEKKLGIHPPQPCPAACNTEQGPGLVGAWGKFTREIRINVGIQLCNWFCFPLLGTLGHQLAVCGHEHPYPLEDNFLPLPSPVKISLVRGDVARNANSIP